MNTNAKIYIAGHNGMVGSAIKRHLEKEDGKKLNRRVEFAFLK